MKSKPFSDLETACIQSTDNLYRLKKAMWDRMRARRVYG